MTKKLDEELDRIEKHIVELEKAIPLRLIVEPDAKPLKEVLRSKDFLDNRRRAWIEALE